MTRLPDPGRRALLKGRVHSPATAAMRPPWTREQRIVDACTRCHACVDACPEGILAAGDGGFPQLDFRLGSSECTFCAACVEACPEPVFDTALSPPLPHLAEVSDGCLPARGVVCETCRDVCPEAAIRFPPRLGGPAMPEISAERCTACGACAGACPVDAVRFAPRRETTKEAAA